MYKKTLNVIKKAIIIIMVATFIGSLIVSQDEHHIETCHEEHCSYCTIIHVAQNIINLSIAFIAITNVYVSIYLFILGLHKERDTFIQSSLVFQKVQLNE